MFKMEQNFETGFVWGVLENLKELKTDKVLDF